MFFVFAKKEEGGDARGSPDFPPHRSKVDIFLLCQQPSSIMPTLSLTKYTRSFFLLLQPAWVKNSSPLSLLLRLHKHTEGGGEHFRSGHPAQHLIHNTGPAGCGREERRGKEERRGEGSRNAEKTSFRFKSVSITVFAFNRSVFPLTQIRD